jgi:NADP-dependent aldehyde dehydrogenase
VQALDGALLLQQSAQRLLVHERHARVVRRNLAHSGHHVVPGYRRRNDPAERSESVTDTVQGTDPRTGEPTWQAAERASALELIADRLDESADKLVETADAETGLGAARLAGEVTRTSNQLRLFGEVLRDGAYVEAIISPATAARPDVRRMLVARGPVAVFSASNFPFAFSVAGGDTASALAAGCPVIVKAHEGHPATSAAVADIVAGALLEAGAPAGTFGIVYGPPIGGPLVQHPAVTAVGFTGSLRGGRALFDLAVRRPDPIPFYGELGSINPVVVLPGAASDDAERVAAGYAASLTMGTGQFCTNPGLIFVPDGAPVLDAIAREVTATTGGPMLTARMCKAYAEHPAWDRLDVLASGTASSDVFSARPEVRQVDLAGFAADIDALTEERFGPAGLVVRYASVDDLADVVGRLPGSLTASVRATAADDAAGIAPALRRIAGRLIMNGWPTGVAVCWAMHHGGPWPATTDSRHTSVGATSIARWLVPVAYQDWPDNLLPAELQRANPLGIARRTG